jgi:hypothetical protein
MMTKFVKGAVLTRRDGLAKVMIPRERLAGTLALQEGRRRARR